MFRQAHRFGISTFFIAALAAVFLATPARAQVAVNVSIGDFYDELEPYGRWVECDYGECWVPERVSRDWQPYSNGEWVYTDYGWTWLSDDPWGDDPYHYGTWFYSDRWGWEWIPGTVWAPAWVTWTYSDRYVGWAPLPPSVAFGASGYSGRPIVVSSTRYVFVTTDRFVGTNVATVRIAPAQVTTIFRQTTPITRFTVSNGIIRNTALPLERIQRATRTRIEKRSIRGKSPRAVTEWTRGNRRQVSIVAPAREVKAAGAARRKSKETANAPASRGRGERSYETRPQAQKQPPGQVQKQQPPGQAKEKGNKGGNKGSNKGKGKKDGG